MTDEEKQAIETLRTIKRPTLATGFERQTNLLKALEQVLNLIENQQRQIEIKDKYLELMWFLGADYDGWDTVDGLKSLIDSLMDYVKKAGKNDDTYAVYEGGNGKYFNILYEEVEMEGK